MIATDAFRNPITWLPFPSIVLTAACLRTEELEYARYSAVAILAHLIDPQEFPKLATHPCTRMWHDYPRKLIVYAYCLNAEWMMRGNEDLLTPEIATLQTLCSAPAKEGTPWWWFLPALARSHASSLWARDQAHYKPYFGEVTPKTVLFWPVGPHLEAMPF